MLCKHLIFVDSPLVLVFWNFKINKPPVQKNQNQRINGSISFTNLENHQLSLKNQQRTAGFLADLSLLLFFENGGYIPEPFL